MSRALDKSVVESLQSGDSTAVYSDISQLLDIPPDSGLLEIELLGSSHPLDPGVNYLRDDNAIAIPRLRLVQAFFVAREILLSQVASKLFGSLDDAALRRATGVVLLMDPEHLTAANTRKRLLQYTLNDKDAGLSDPAVFIKREKAFTDSLLTSHLHRHTKSPTLWSHRRWLIETSQSLGLITDIATDMRSVITVAANRHPRNYYAWSHARWLVETVLPSPPEREEQHIQIAEVVVNLVKDWSFRHHSDTSGWSFLYFMGKTFQPETTSVIPSIFTETLRLASSFRWTNESVWVFLRTIAASDMVGCQERLYFRDGIEALKKVAGGKDGIKILDSALQWSKDYNDR